ncbi:hypothetical protein [Novosphingobium olei]|uniref:Uncharacterized protein n=1 Tax=Novosphingobium olei TaxID=2728851 RepID=A0A7Y0BMU1_9SPHN|nr:hypothetical protein [Novosphingobium olei]NML93386.1 hypothetical protein [Novosphingobium olei]
MMLSLAHLLSVLALSVTGPVGAEHAVRADVWRAAMEPEGPPMLPNAARSGAMPDILDALSNDVWNQVRIEQRLVIRIAPPRSAGREIAQPPPFSSIRFRERKMANCLPVLGIAGVQATTDSRLLLFMRDRRIVGASLDKQCRAADFYMGFYVQQTQDGLLCVGRDSIHSRSGTTCSVSKLRELIPGE